MVEIIEINRGPEKPDGVTGFAIDEPRSGSSFSSFELPMSGWVTTRRPVRAIEARGHGYRWTFSPIARPDVAKRFPDIPEEQKPVFQGNISSLRLPLQFDIALVVVFYDGDETLIGRIRGVRDSMQPRFRPELQPILLHCLGRSGSTWTTHLLAQHPEIIAYQTFRLEPRVSGYWMDVFGALAEPASYTQVLQPEVTGEDWWLGRNRKKVLSMHQIDEQMAHWLGGSAVETLADFCMSRIEEFYRTAAHGQGKSGPRFFVERSYGIGTFAPRMVRELYRDSREIFLVRDFRDVFCSMKAFKGSSLPRRQLAKDDVDYVRNQLRDYIAGLYRGWLERKESAFLLRYEDLVKNPTDTLIKLFGFIGVDDDSNSAARVLDQANSLRPERQVAHKTVSDPLSSIDRWQSELAPEVREAFLDSMGDLLEEFGYPVDPDLAGRPA